MVSILLTMTIQGCDLTESKNSEPLQITWEQVGFDKKRVLNIEVSPTGGVFATVLGSGIFASYDQGKTWELLKTGRIRTRGLSINDNGYLFATLSDQLYRSKDSGNSWELILERVFGFIYAGDDNLVLVDDGRVMKRSTDNGDTWTVIDSLPNTLLNHYRSFFLLPNNELYLGTNGYGVYCSSDYGNTWSSVLDLSNATIDAFALGLEGDLFCGSNWGSIFRSDNGGQSWKEVFDFDERIYDIEVNTNGHVFAVVLGKGIFGSMDKGQTWESLDNDIPEVGYGSFAIDELGYIYASIPGKGLYRSSEPTTY